MSLYAALLLVTVTVHTSVPSPTLRNPKNYSLNTCSGVFVGPDLLLTAGHCMEHSRGYQWIKTSDGKSLAVSVMKIDTKTDLALLKVIKPINHPYTSLGSRVGRADIVYTVNSGYGYERTFNQGMVNNVLLDEDSLALTILHNAMILPGASGSGLFNSDRQLIGINVATIRGFSEAVDVVELRKFLDERL